MKKIIILLILLDAAVWLSSLGVNEEPQAMEAMEAITTENLYLETAVFSGGCFWGVEAVFESLNGVSDVVSGYSGGKEETAKYKMVGNGHTDHAESVKISYDPQIIDYNKLLEIFFLIAHDPTQLNYQDPDRGREYRSVIFYLNEYQRNSTNNYIKKLKVDKIFSIPIVTEVVPLKEFYKAESYHQNFMRLNPRHPYIVSWDIPKLNKLKKLYPELIK